MSVLGVEHKIISNLACTQSLLLSNASSYLSRLSSAVHFSIAEEIISSAFILRFSGNNLVMTSKIDHMITIRKFYSFNEPNHITQHYHAWTSLCFAPRNYLCQFLQFFLQVPPWTFLAKQFWNWVNFQQTFLTFCNFESQRSGFWNCVRYIRHV